MSQSLINDIIHYIRMCYMYIISIHNFCHTLYGSQSLAHMNTVFTWLNAAAFISLVQKIDAATIQGRLLFKGGV